MGTESQEGQSGFESASERIEALRAFEQSSNLFTHLLLDLPDGAFVDGIEGFSFGTEGVCEDGSDDTALGMALIDRYVATAVDRDAEEVLTELSVDRTRLLRGLTAQGPRPPYESLYVGSSANDSVLSIKDAYRAADCHVAESIKDAPEHLGFEVAFMGTLAGREAQALADGNDAAADEARAHAASFMADHLGRWGISFADEMLRFATTDFYRGITHLFKDYIVEGKQLFA